MYIYIYTFEIELTKKLMLNEDDDSGYKVRWQWGMVPLEAITVLRVISSDNCFNTFLGFMPRWQMERYRVANESIDSYFL